MHIITPKRWIDLKSPANRIRALYFLAGPVRGGGDWQQHMARSIAQYDLDALIVVPTRWDATHKLAGHFIGENTGKFERQLDFERHYMRGAAHIQPRGCLVFYLAKQVEPRPVEDGPYAQDTYGEFGAWRTHLMYSPKQTRMVVGAEAGFPGLDVMVRNLRADVGYEFPIYESLEDTAKAAVAIANK